MSLLPAHIALQRLVVRMLHDPAFVDAVFADPDRSLAGIPERERSWILALDRRAYRTDPERADRVLVGLLEEFPVTAAQHVRMTRNAHVLDSFFSTRSFHEGMQAGESISILFGRFLEDLARQRGDRAALDLARLETAIALVRRERGDEAGGATGGDTDDAPGVVMGGAPDIAMGGAPDVAVSGAPDIATRGAPDVAVSGALDIAMGGAPDIAMGGAPDVAVSGAPDVAVSGAPDIAAHPAAGLPERAASRGRSIQGAASMESPREPALELSPRCAAFRVETPVLAHYDARRGALQAAAADPRTAIFDLDLPWPSLLAPAASWLLLTGTLGPELGEGGVRKVIDVNVEETSAELAQLLLSARGGATRASLLATLHVHGAASGEDEEILADLVRDGLLLPH